MCTSTQRSHGRCLGFIALLVAVGAPATAQTYISAEPIPSGTVVGSSNLAAIQNLGYANMALWSRRLQACGLVDNILDTLSGNRAITTLRRFNSTYQVAAGGFQGVTDPSYVFAVLDSGPGAVNKSDVFVLANALGYALNQDGTAQFSLRYDPSNANDFSIVYAVVTFDRYLSGEQAQGFFNYLGTIDPALWTGANAGFTQVPLNPFGPDNSMLFLIGSVSTSEFESGLYKAVKNTPDARYQPLLHGQPSVATAGVAFPGNDWVAFPKGDQYLVNLPNSPRLLSQLAALRQTHLRAVSNLIAAIGKGHVDDYLRNHFACP